MNPDGMVLLLNYREDGITRTYDHDPPCYIFSLYGLHSVLHFLEGWCERGQIVDRLSERSLTRSVLRRIQLYTCSILCCLIPSAEAVHIWLRSDILTRKSRPCANRPWNILFGKGISHVFLAKIV